MEKLYPAKSHAFCMQKNTYMVCGSVIFAYSISNFAPDGAAMVISCNGICFSW
jgi:hypothetical protein